MQKGIFRLNKGFIGSKFNRVDLAYGTIYYGQSVVCIAASRAKARKVLEASDLSGLLHSIEIGTSKGRHLLRRTAKGAPRLVGSVDQADVNVRGDIGIDPKSPQVVDGLRALMSGHTDIPGLRDFGCSRTAGENITQAVDGSAFLIVGDEKR